jgi:hypothetical protein
MSIDYVAAARDYAEQAAAVAANLKPGSYESAKALALISMAHSLAVLADAEANER